MLKTNIEILLFRNKGTHIILAFADIIDIGGNATINVKEFIKLDYSVKHVSSRMNKDKTKYMIATCTEDRDRVGENVTMEQHNFEWVHEFEFLGATLTSDNDMTMEINNRIQSANRSCFALKSKINSKNISGKTKRKLYHAIVRPIMTYACETWTLI